MMISPLKCSINISYSNEISDSLGLGTYGHRNTRQRYQFTVKAAAVAGQATRKHEEKNDGGLVLVNPKQGKKDSFSSRAIDWLEKLIIREQKQQHYHQPPPFHFLSHNFAPVIEETPPASKHLPIKTGHFPECLNGEFMRVGPNPKFAPVFGYHWFDGDGMIHGVRIKDGKARYASRYVRTSRLIQEEFLGCAKFLKIGDAKGLLGLLMGGLFFLRQIFRVLDFSYGYGTANTALTYHHGKLLALHEGDKPYVIKILEDGDMETIGMWDYEKRLNHPLTAHPKIDPVTGEMFTFGYSQLPPYVIYRVISKNGYMNDPVPISVSGPIMMHDFAITENYAIFVDAPMYFRPQDMVKDEKLILTFDATKSARFGVLPRYAKNDSQIKWFELPSCFISHNANAWEEGDEVVLITCRLEYMDLESYNGTIRDKIENIKYQLYEMRFNLITGEAFQKKLSQPAIDFPKVNDNYIGRKNQYVYGSIFDSVGRVEGIIKFDLHEEPETGKSKLEVGGNVKGIFDFGAGRFGSETIFVPRQPDLTSEEDDGYLIFFVHDVNTGKSEMNVIDAKTMAHDPVAVVELPNRVPYGFHALFVTEAQLEEQWKQ